MENGHIGVVVALDKDEAVVRFERSSMCAHCGGCLTVGEREMETRIENSLSAKVGDQVMVSMQARRLVSASVLAYAVPLSALLLGVALGGMISDVAAIVLGLIGCCAAFLCLRVIDRKIQKNRTYQPIMIAIQTSEEE